MRDAAGPLNYFPMIPGRSRWSRLAIVVTLYAAMAAAAVVWATHRGAPNMWRPPGPEERHRALGLAAGLALGLAIVAGSRLAVRRYAWARALHRELRALLGPLTDRDVVVMAVASSVGEEMFFRGALYPAIGLWASSAVFALLHIGPRARFLPWTISAFVAGLLFASLFRWSGDLTGPVLAHFTVNLLNLHHLRHHAAPDRPAD